MSRILKAPYSTSSPHDSKPSYFKRPWTRSKRILGDNCLGFSDEHEHDYEESFFTKYLDELGIIYDSWFAEILNYIIRPTFLAENSIVKFSSI